MFGAMVLAETRGAATGWRDMHEGRRMHRYLRQETGIVKLRTATCHALPNPTRHVPCPRGYYYIHTCPRTNIVQPLYRLRLAHRTTLFIARWTSGHSEPAALGAPSNISKACVGRERAKRDATYCFGPRCCDRVLRISSPVAAGRDRELERCTKAPANHPRLVLQLRSNVQSR